MEVLSLNCSSPVIRGRAGRGKASPPVLEI
jgi:hypothetical protein